MDSGKGALWRFVGCAMKICWGGWTVSRVSLSLVALSIQIEDRIENLLPTRKWSKPFGRDEDQDFPININLSRHKATDYCTSRVRELRRCKHVGER